MKRYLRARRWSCNACKSSKSVVGGDGGAIRDASKSCMVSWWPPCCRVLCHLFPLVTSLGSLVRKARGPRPRLGFLVVVISGEKSSLTKVARKSVWRRLGSLNLGWSALRSEKKVALIIYSLSLVFL